MGTLEIIKVMENDEQMKKMMKRNAESSINPTSSENIQPHLITLCREFIGYLDEYQISGSLVNIIGCLSASSDLERS
jgi:hypothetical protein